jgi:hypothetical protein
MANEHARSVKLAGRTTDGLYALFAKLGTAQHPRGAVLSAYRQARRALKGNVDQQAVVEEILFDLQTAVSNAARNVYQEAVTLGEEQAMRELATYGLPFAEANLALEVENALRATISALDIQINNARLLIGDEAMLIGDANRVGLLSPAPVIRDAARSTTRLTVEAHKQTTEQGIIQGGAVGVFLRQAIAALDERTTETCLRVHGQTTSIDGDFKLVGTPRFANRLHSSPFHFFCRTTIALVLKKQAEDELTRNMRAAAQAELAARETTGERVEIHPASALSRR